MDARRVLTGILLLAPVVNPWYLTTLVPLAIAAPSPAWLAWTGLVNLAYLHGLAWGDAWYRWVEYASLALCLIIAHFRGQRLPNANGPPSEEGGPLQEPGA